MIHHLVILKKHYLFRVLRGYKTVECRLSRHKRPPFGVVTVGDTLWLKQSGGPVTATATVARVEYAHPLTIARLTLLRLRYGESIQADSDFFDGWRQARYATIIHLGNVRRIDPFRLKKNDRRAWVPLAGPLVTSLCHQRTGPGRN